MRSARTVPVPVPVGLGGDNCVSVRALVAVKGVSMVIASLGAIQARFRGLVGVRMSLPRSHLGRVLGLVSGRYARVWRVLHCRLISHRVGAGGEGWTSLGQAIRYS